jgi:hypothetical protein
MDRYTIVFLEDQEPAHLPPLIRKAKLLALGPDQAIRHARRRWPSAYQFEIIHVTTNIESAYDGNHYVPPTV